MPLKTPQKIVIFTIKKCIGAKYPKKYNLILRKPSLLQGARLKKMARALRQSHSGKTSISWEDFAHTVDVLKQFVAIVPDELDARSGMMTLTDLGYVARDIRFENELWLAMVLDVNGYNRALAVRSLVYIQIS